MAAEYTFGPLLAMTPGAKVPAVGATATLRSEDRTRTLTAYTPDGVPTRLTADAFGYASAGFRADEPRVWVEFPGQEPILVQASNVPITQEEAQRVADETATEVETRLTGTFVAQADTGSAGLAVLAAALPADARQALEITVNTSVGTRVIIGGVMVYGDTGRRDLTALVSPPPTAGWLRIRRINQTIEVASSTLAVPASGTVTLLTLPSGFRPKGNFPFRAIPYWSGETQETGRVAFNGDIGFRALSSGNQMNFSAMYTTDDPWPTTLPGTPV